MAGRIALYGDRNRIDPYAQEKLAFGEMDFSAPVFTQAAEN